MKFSELVVLLPCHSLDDFPFHLEGAAADGLLAAWSALWHPALLAGAEKSPTWHRVDSPPSDVAGKLVVVPEVAAGQLPVGWQSEAREAGATVIVSAPSRGSIVAMALGESAQTLAIDPELLADFFALGLCRLWGDLLAQQRYYTTTLDELVFARELTLGSQAALAGNQEAAKAALTHAFQMLSAGRQYFYPADSFFIDLTLVAPTTLGPALAAELIQAAPINLLVPVTLLDQISHEQPATWQALTAALERGTVSLIGGEQEEGLLPLVPLENVLTNLMEGQRSFERLIGRQLKVFGRRRYGLAPSLPQILDKLGFQGALHVTLDDGRFPLRVQSKVRWQGDDTSAIDSIARLPRDAAQPHTFLELPRRLADAMDTDHVATIVLAHWPGMTSPWYADLRRIARYTGALGRFVTAGQYFNETYAPGEHARFLADEYRSPYLKQSVAAGEHDPLSRIVAVHRQQAECLATEATATMAQIAAGRMMAPSDAKTALSELAGALPRTSGPAGPRTLVVNPLGHRQSVLVERPEIAGTAKPEEIRSAIADVPAMGFAWIDWTTPAPKRSRREKPLAEGHTLHNEFFQLTIDPATGGVQRLDDYRHRTNRLSQQLALRTPGEAALASRLGETQDEQAIYSRMQADEVRVTAAEFDWGEITSRGQLLDASGQRVAGFVQRTRVERANRLIELSIELDPVAPPTADPWQAYYAARFAWDSAAADVWRGVHSSSHPTVAQQIEAPEYIEIDSGVGRTAILTGGWPYHRRSGPRIIDSLLIVPGESARRFQLAIGVDLANPAAAAQQLIAPRLALHEIGQPPAGGGQGWLFHIDARSVIATHWQTLVDESIAGPRGFRVRLLETSGRSVKVTLRSCRAVTKAARIDFCGRSLGDLEIEQDQVFCELAGHEWAQIEAFW